MNSDISIPGFQSLVLRRFKNSGLDREIEYVSQTLRICSTSLPPTCFLCFVLTVKMWSLRFMVLPACTPAIMDCQGPASACRGILRKQYLETEKQKTWRQLWVKLTAYVLLETAFQFALSMSHPPLSLEITRKLSLYVLLMRILQAVLLCWIAHLLQMESQVFYFAYLSSHITQIHFWLSYESASHDSFDS